MTRVFFGHDEREAVGTHTFIASVLEHAKQPVELIPLHLPVLEATFGRRFAQGTNAFTAARFLCAALADFAGPPVVFVDGADMIMRADVGELVAAADPLAPVSVVKHDYRTRNPRKYRGTPMEAENRDYERKQWASVMVIQPWAYEWRRLTPDRVAEMPLIDLLQFRWIADERIGSLPVEWNWLADEHGYNQDAKLVHYTAGVPGFAAHADVAHADEWRRQLRRVNYAIGV